MCPAGKLPNANATWRGFLLYGFMPRHVLPRSISSSRAGFQKADCGLYRWGPTDADRRNLCRVRGSPHVEGRESERERELPGHQYALKNNLLSGRSLRGHSSVQPESQPSVSGRESNRSRGVVCPCSKCLRWRVAFLLSSVSQRHLTLVSRGVRLAVA